RVHDPDGDEDGLPDLWEQRIVDAFPTQYANVAEVFPDEDPDEDGLTNPEEHLADTDPTDPDSDGDGMKDGGEVDHRPNPPTDDAALDPDQDGLTNLEEHQLGADPANPDGDGDGLWDGWEVLHNFNPASAPGDLSDATGDPDGDG